MGRDTFVPAKALTAAQKREVPDILGAVLGTPEQMIRSELRYDYSLIPEAQRNQVQTAAVAIVKHGRTAQESLIEVGKRLIEVKDLLEHGQFQNWCATEFDMSYKTALRMMQVANVFGEKKDTVSFLSDSVMYMLAAPSTPESARAAVIEQAQATGESPTKAEVQEIIAQYKPMPPAAAVFNNTPPPVVPPTPVVVREYVRQPKVVTLPTAPLSQVAIINADSRQLPGMGLDPVHLVITSPPYNVGIEYDQYNDSSADYIPLLLEVWRACYDVMVDGARIAVVVPFGVGRNPYIPFDCQIMQTLVDVGFTLRGRIVWDKNTTGNRTSWGSYRLPSSPALRDTTECIIVAHKGSDTLEIPAEHKGVDDKGTHTCWLRDGDYFMELTQDHWVVAPESAQRVGHPAPFPVELVKRLMHFYAYPGAHVLDPFAGSGTVGVAAKMVGCQATLIEVSGNYCAIATERIND